MSEHTDMLGQAAFLCAHVVRRGAPVLYVSHDPPTNPQDSGWTFSCGDDRHEMDDWLLVSVEEGFGMDATLDTLRTMPVSHEASRPDGKTAWQISPG
jgi:hypothetical protein